MPALRFQPVDVEDVAARLVELAASAPLGRALDLGGPEVRHAVELARAYLTAIGGRRTVVPVRLPGRTFRALSSGGAVGRPRRHWPLRLASSVSVIASAIGVAVIPGATTLTVIPSSPSSEARQRANPITPAFDAA
ncbi:hypothetical protein [Pseudonocardia parietis]|uniref:Uncharacterized protein YbjT (DUF2867 family) n=1 Tax=Pseudonocardia parietis TaxID=570936 RepID=A0ABS4VMH9_9PSEU|nr:hypothetical protein [Pseudonocardia parietis]MBP2365117.1 uncharacterized protein YbjT (DUF2867 family) [Pseudonocardia parietis]